MEPPIPSKVHDGLWQISALKRCLEMLKMSREIPEAMWLARGAIATYMQSAGSNYAAKMQCLEALRILGCKSDNVDHSDPVWEHLDEIERDLRGKAQGVRQARATTDTLEPLSRSPT
jgi:hypothetical protein